MITMQWRSQPKILGRAKYFDFKRTTIFGLGHRFSKHKTKRYMLKLEGAVAPLRPMATPI